MIARLQIRKREKWLLPLAVLQALYFGLTWSAMEQQWLGQGIGVVLAAVLVPMVLLAPALFFYSALGITRKRFRLSPANCLSAFVALCSSLLSWGWAFQNIKLL